MGPLALVGGSEWAPDVEFNAHIAQAVEANEVVILATAAAYETPSRLVDQARTRLSDQIQVTDAMVYDRRSAHDDQTAQRVAQARFIYVTDGSALHLRSVLKESPVWQALGEAWRNGAAVVGSGAGATVMGDPMVDPRGGTFTLGLGLVPSLAVVPHWERWTNDRARRMTHLVPKAAVVAELDDATALIRWPEGNWTVEGRGSAALSLNHQPVKPDQLSELVGL